MKKVLASLTSVWFLFFCSSHTHAAISLWDWGINIDGTTYCLEGPCDFDFLSTSTLFSLTDLPSSIDYTEFDISVDGDIGSGLGSLAITVTGPGSHSVSVYLNYDIDYSLNGNLNETGEKVGVSETGLSWEIDEIGWGALGSSGSAGNPYTGNIFENFTNSGTQTPPYSLLDNQIFYNDFLGQSLIPPIEDTALAKSWDFDLLEGETAIITFVANTVEPTSGFYIVQQDPDSETNVYLTSHIVLDSSCAGTVDCMGVCDGTATEDNCGVCDIDPNNDCTQDCAGTWGGTAYMDNCNTCVGGDTGLTECGQDCAGIWGGDAVVDNCGICDADPTNDCTQDCAGTWGGEAVVDNCETCDADPTNDCTRDCAGTWGGDAVVDNCGICDADSTNDCAQDCAGTWGGDAIVDNCGICDSDPTNDCIQEICSDLDKKRCKRRDDCKWDGKEKDCKEKSFYSKKKNGSSRHKSRFTVPAQAMDRSVIVGFHSKPGFSEEALLHGQGGKIKRKFRHISAYTAKLSDQAMERLRKDPKVKYVIEDRIYWAIEPVEVAADPIEYQNSWGVEHIGSLTAHANNIAGNGVRVAILDSGIDYTHQELATNYQGGWDFVFDDDDPYDDSWNSHGTHVAGIIAAAADGSGVVGVAPNAELYAVKVLDGAGFGLLSWIMEGIEWAVENEIDVVNISIGGPHTVALQDACDAAYNAGVLLVAAAGNGAEVAYPAAYDSVIAVTGTDNADQQGWFAPIGSQVELAAPGVVIQSTSVNNEYAELSGTSQAAPHVSGVAALVFSAGTNDLNNDGIVNNQDVRMQLQLSAQDLGDTGKDDVYGYGLIDVAAALEIGDDNPGSSFLLGVYKLLLL